MGDWGPKMKKKMFEFLTSIRHPLPIILSDFDIGCIVRNPLNLFPKKTFKTLF